MSEPDISTLARRLAEQNNVDWRNLGGSGPSGKVVERDVLDYLARVMAGMEAVDSTPEPLPEGVKAWSNQEAPSYVHDVATTDVEVAAAEGIAAEADGVRELTEPAAPPAAEPASAVADGDSYGDQVVDELLSDDIFLFDAEDPPEQPSSSASAFTTGTPFAGDGAEAGVTPNDMSDEVATSPTYLSDEVATSPADMSDEVDDLLLVEDEADAVQYRAYDGAYEDAAARRDEQTTPEFDAPATDHSAHSGSGFSADAFASDDASTPAPPSADSYAEPRGVDVDTWGVQPQASDPFGFSDDPTFESGEDEALPDLWASDDAEPEPAAAEPFRADEPSDDAGPWLSDHEAAAPTLTHDAVAPSSEGWHDGGEVASTADSEFAPSAAAPVDSWQEPSHDAAPVSADDEVARFELEPLGDGDDLTTLEEAERLDELDSLEDVQALDGTRPEFDVVAAVASLPLVRSGAVLRRHLDVSALAAAQLAVGVELGGDPLEAAPFLLRAVARAAAELGIMDGQVALAELKGGVTLRRVDHADSRTFRSLIEDLQQDGAEEDEVGLVAVDLSGLDVDEVMLDVAAPAVTLGRILYDNQHGAYRSTLVLTGELPLDKGAKLLSRVAELLDAPVRLLL